MRKTYRTSLHKKYRKLEMSPDCRILIILYSQRRRLHKVGFRPYLNFILKYQKRFICYCMNYRNQIFDNKVSVLDSLKRTTNRKNETTQKVHLFYSQKGFHLIMSIYVNVIYFFFLFKNCNIIFIFTIISICF